MGSFSKKQQEPQAPQINTAFNFTSPYGNYGAQGTSSWYEPILSPYQRQVQDMTERKMFDTLDHWNTDFNVNDYYNNPFYHSTLRQLQTPLNQQYQDEAYDLNNTLSARNQLGGSYDAMMRDRFNRRRDQAYRMAEDQARGVSAQAYQQQFNNQLAGLVGLRNDWSTGMDAQMKPLNFAMNAQNSALQGQMNQANLNQRQQMFDANLAGQNALMNTFMSMATRGLFG